MNTLSLILVWITGIIMLVLGWYIPTAEGFGYLGIVVLVLAIVGTAATWLRRSHIDWESSQDDT